MMQQKMMVNELALTAQEKGAEVTENLKNEQLRIVFNTIGEPNE